LYLAAAGLSMIRLRASAGGYDDFDPVSLP